MAVSAAERRFYVELGQRIAALRKARGLTQTQLAEHLGVAQQTLAHYEAGRLRLLAGALPTLAEQLAVSVEELIGSPVTVKTGTGKRGPVPKLQLQLERISALPKARQRVVSEVLDSLLAQPAR
ncbi:MAG: helix-turn-helix domain-containing protein [Rhodanobacteraceae bacterium]|nr:helix-turn-helix domain-containing protein [Rhodanobacteraceae bacterium]